MIMKDCNLCGSRGCHVCMGPDTMLQMRHEALRTLSDGSNHIVDLVAERAAAAGWYRTDDPRNCESTSATEVDAACAFCNQHSVINIKGAGYYCLSCEKSQPIELVDCVYCQTTRTAVKQIDSCRCYLCNKDQPVGSNVVSIR